MMVGVPVLLVVCVSAFVPFVWVMGVVVGVSGWWVFQCRVAVVWASRRVPGVGVCVSWLVPGACLGVVGVGVGVSWLVCVLWWFRMLTCLASFRVFLSWFCLFCLVNNGLPWVWCGGLRVCGVVVAACCVFGVCACCLVVCAPPLVVGLVAGAGRVVFAPVGYWVVACVLVSRGVRVGLLVVVLLARECECWCLVVSVVVWVWGVLLLVAFFLCGFVTVLLRVV